MKIILEGHVVPMNASRPNHHFKGRVLINNSRITSVKTLNQRIPAEFSEAKIVSVGDDYIYPGLLDLHSHLGYNSLPLWTHPGEAKPFLNRNTWPGRSSYKPDISWPAWVLVKAAPEAFLTYVQVQALAGGTTTIQGWPGQNRRPANYLLRSADDEIVENDKDVVRTSVVTLSTEQLRKKQPFLETGGFIYHCGEGQLNSTVVKEFEDVANANCLRQRLIAIHCCAIGQQHFEQWRNFAMAAGDPAPGSVVWSPFSNLWLYGETTLIPAAKANGINVCLGTDWGPSGTKNLLGELKVARLISDDQGWDLSNFDLVEMVTANPGDAMSRCWSSRNGDPLPVGRLVANALADIAVFKRRHDSPWDNLVSAHEEDLRLVFVDGNARFGEKTLMKQSGATRTTSVKVGRTNKHTVLTNPKDENRPVEERRRWFYKNVLEALEAVRENPNGTLEATTGSRALADDPVFERSGPEDNPLILELDMAGGLGQAAGKPPDDVKVDIPPIASIRHDRNWRSTLKNRGFHGGLLDRMDDFYD